MTVLQVDPYEREECALIDGATRLQILRSEKKTVSVAILTELVSGDVYQ